MRKLTRGMKSKHQTYFLIMTEWKKPFLLQSRPSLSPDCLVIRLYTHHFSPTCPEFKARIYELIEHKLGFLAFFGSTGHLGRRQRGGRVRDVSSYAHVSRFFYYHIKKLDQNLQTCFSTLRGQVAQFDDNTWVATLMCKAWIGCKRVQVATLAR